MSDPTIISPDPPENKGLDFAALKEEGIELVQRWSGDIWTDYNEHDPGVTTLEQLCYALTELSYRAEFPLRDLLMEKGADRIDPRRQALFVPKSVLPCNPLTQDDYRKLLIDRVPGLGNAWLTPMSEDLTDGVGGLYTIWLYVPEEDDRCNPDPSCCKPNPVWEKARHVYNAHRSLCEDVYELRLLQPLRTLVSADVSVDAGMTPEDALAGVFFRVGLLFGPEPARQALKSLLDEGRSPAEIFTGPLLLNGFIADAALAPKAAEIPVRDIVRAMVDGEGVQGAANVAVRVAGQSNPFTGNDTIPVPTDRFLDLDVRPRSDTGFSIRILKNGTPCRPDPGRVRRALDRLWAARRQTFKLANQYDELLAFPKGRYRDLTEYYSVQNQFPNIYGINAFGLPGDATAKRKGQAKQLKGYLLAFEQLLADFFSQLARVKDLYSTEPALDHSYFYQYIDKDVPNVAPLLKPDDGSGPDAQGYRQGLPEIVHGQDPAVARRNRFLDVLLALYAQVLKSDIVFDSVCDGGTEGPGGVRLILAKLALLNNLVQSTRDRGRGFDYLGDISDRNMAGMIIKSLIELGVDTLPQSSLSNALADSYLTLAEAGETMPTVRSMRPFSDLVDAEFSEIQPLAADDPMLTAAGPGAATAVSGLASGKVDDGFVRAAARLEQYRMGTLPNRTDVTVVCKAPSDRAWRLVGDFADRDQAVAGAQALSGMMADLAGASRQLYIVEHVLLRFGQWEGQDGGQPDDQGGSRHRHHLLHHHQQQPRNMSGSSPAGDGGFDYSFSITAVLSTDGGRHNDPDYQAFARQVVRRNTPAHIDAGFCFLSPAQMLRFEKLYWEWRRALHFATQDGDYPDDEAFASDEPGQYGQEMPRAEGFETAADDMERCHWRLFWACWRLRHYLTQCRKQGASQTQAGVGPTAPSR